MGILVELKYEPRQVEDKTEVDDVNSKSGDVLFFTGVRYSRPNQDKPAKNSGDQLDVFKRIKLATSVLK